MKSKVGGGIKSYILIFIGIVIACIIACGGLMLLAPGVEIFGISYFSNNKEIACINVGEQNLTSLLRSGNINEIEIANKTTEYSGKTYKSGVSDILVDKNEDYPALKVIIYDKSVGYTKDKTHTSVQSSAEIANKKLTISIDDPMVAWNISKNIKVVIEIPEDINTNELSITANTTSGSITAGDDTNFSLKNLNFKTVSGMIEIRDTITAKGNINLESLTGAIKLSNQTSSPQRTVALKSNTGKMIVENIKASTLNITSEKSVISLKDTTGDVIYSSPYGIITGNNITGNFTATELVKVSEINFKKVTGDVSIVSGQTTNITLGETSGKLRVITTSGDINIGKILGLNDSYHELSTQSGNITFDCNVGVCIKANTTTGKINANYTQIYDKKQELTTTKGSINLTLSANQVGWIICKTSEKISMSWASEYRTGEYTIELGNVSSLNIETSNKKINCTSNSGNINVTEKVS